MTSWHIVNGAHESVLPIVSVLISLVSFFGLTISKEQKVSEFRQAWIDALREDIAKLMGKMTFFLLQVRALSSGKLSDSQSLWEQHTDELREFDEIITRIRLRVNVKEDLPKKFLSVSGELEHRIMGKGARFEAADIECLQYLKEQAFCIAQELLKSEWEVVKKGEPFFRWSRWVVLALSGLLFAEIVLRTLRAG